MSKLLLIDDETDVQYSFRRIFDASDVEMFTASSGEEGLRLLPKVKPDLVLMDVRMGGMSGLETLRRIREADPKLLVILMTAYGTTQTAIEAMKLGAYDYLLKPFDVPKLKEIVTNALRAARDMKQVVSYQPLLETEDYELGIVGRSESMQQVFKLIGQLANELEHLLHRLAAADDAQFIILRLQQRLIRNHLFHVPRRAQGVRNDFLQLGNVEGLQQVIVGPELHRLDRSLRRAVGGHQNDEQLGVGFPDPPQRLQAAHATHAHVHQHKVRLYLGEKPQSFLTAGRRKHLDVGRVKDSPERVLHVRLVID